MGVNHRHCFAIEFILAGVYKVFKQGVAVMQWLGHGSFNQEVPCSVPCGLRLCQEGHPTSNAPVPH